MADLGAIGSSGVTYGGITNPPTGGVSGITLASVIVLGVALLLGIVLPLVISSEGGGLSGAPRAMPRLAGSIQLYPMAA